MKGLQNSSEFIFPNLQKRSPENNTVIWSNKEKTFFFFFFFSLFTSKSLTSPLFPFCTKQQLCHNSSGLASSIGKMDCFCSCWMALTKLTLVILLTCLRIFLADTGLAAVCALAYTPQRRAEVDGVLPIHPSACSCCCPSPGSVRSVPSPP